MPVSSCSPESVSVFFFGALAMQIPDCVCAASLAFFFAPRSCICEPIGHAFARAVNPFPRSHYLFLRDHNLFSRCVNLFEV